MPMFDFSVRSCIRFLHVRKIEAACLDRSSANRQWTTGRVLAWESTVMSFVCPSIPFSFLVCQHCPHPITRQQNERWKTRHSLEFFVVVYLVQYIKREAIATKQVRSSDYSYYFLQYLLIYVRISTFFIMIFSSG